MCCRRCCRPDFNPHARHVSDGAHSGNQPAFRGPEICGVGTAEDAAERDLTPRTISNCLRHLEIKLSKRSLMSTSSIKPLLLAEHRVLHQHYRDPRHSPSLLLHV